MKFMFSKLFVHLSIWFNIYKNEIRHIDGIGGYDLM